jgi:hypothetical protein
MKFDSPLFNRIRVKPEQDRRPKADAPGCDWPGCAHAASHRAPKGRTREREYWRFCLEHVREYNQSYNFFAGMTDDAVARYQKDAITGHRPTWKMGVLGGKRTKTAERRFFFDEQYAGDDPFDIMREIGGIGPRPDHAQKAAPRRTVRNAERKALHALGLEDYADRTEIKGRFKELVKRHHPDANGGDRGSEDKLREIIEAYNYLKSTGWC